MRWHGAQGSCFVRNIGQLKLDGTVHMAVASWGIEVS